MRVLYHAVVDLLRRVEKAEIASRTLQRKLITQGALIMGTKQELEAAIAQVKLDLVAEKDEVAVEIQKLKDQIAQGSPVTPQDLDALIASVNEIGAGVKDIVTPTV